MAHSTFRPAGALALAMALATGATHLREPPLPSRATFFPPPLRIDVNRAPGRLLVLLPGIGPARATAIRAARIRDGPFAGLDELERVRGIGPKTVAGLRASAAVTGGGR